MFKTIIYLLICCLIRYQLVFCNESNYEIKSNVSIESDTEEYAEELEEPKKCSLDKLMDKLEKYIPNAIDFRKDVKIRQTVDNMNESIAIVKNLVQLLKPNIDNNLMIRLTQRITELFISMDLKPECMSTIVRIGESARNMEGWALKC